MISNMNNKFKYDYNNKLFLINLSLSIIFFVLAIVSFEKLVGFILLFVMSMLALFNSLFIRMQGIKIKSKVKIVIIDQLLIRKLSIQDVRYVSLELISKDTKSKLYGFFTEFFYPNTYLSHCKYVYNQGKVYNICFHMNDGTIVKSYFGWLYREKEKTVRKVEKKLHNFIEEINNLCRDNRNKL